MAGDACLEHGARQQVAPGDQVEALGDLEDGAFGDDAALSITTMRSARRATSSSEWLT